MRRLLGHRVFVGQGLNRDRVKPFGDKAFHRDDFSPHRAGFVIAACGVVMGMVTYFYVTLQGQDNFADGDLARRLGKDNSAANTFGGLENAGTDQFRENPSQEIFRNPKTLRDIGRRNRFRVILLRYENQRANRVARIFPKQFHINVSP